MFEIGNSLREARLRQGLDLTDVERFTKIRPKYLRGLEEEHFELLPAQPYVKGFLRAYAEFLGLDGQLYVDEYNSRYVARDDDVPFRPRRSVGRPRSGRVGSGVVVAALIGIAVVFGLVIAAWKSGDDEAVRAPIAQPDLRTPAEPYLVVRAIRGATGLEVHERSRHGKLRWAGTLENGKTQRFALRRNLWLYIQKPRRVQLVVSGRTLAAPGRFVLARVRGGLARAPAR